MPTRTISLRDNNSQAAFLQSQLAYRKASAHFVSDSARWKEARQSLLKQASFGENQNPQFEQAFGSVAFTYLQEKAPGLVPYILGFQLLDRDEDGKKALGVFVAEVGDKKIDIPMFFVNGELKGHQVMRLRKPELYLPLRESFLDYLFSKIPQDLGDAGISLNTGTPVQSTPDMQPFSGSRYVKGATEDWMHEWATEAGVASEYAAMRYQPENLELGIALLEKKKNAHVNLIDILSRPGSGSLLKTAAALCDNYPAFRKMMDDTLGSDWLKTAATKAFQTKPTTKAAIALPKQQSGVSIGRNKQAAERVAGLTFSRDKMRIKVANVNHDAIAAEIDKYGEHAIDYRTEDKLAKAYEVEETNYTVEPPDTLGMFDVLDVNGKRKQMMVIPAMNRTTGDGLDLIIDLKSKRWCNVGRTRYVAYCSGEGYDINATDKALKTNARRPSPGDIFCVYHKGQVAGPFFCRKQLGTDRFEVDDQSTSFVVNNKGDRSGDESTSGLTLRHGNSISTVIFVEASKDDSTNSGRYGTLTVPKSQKVVVLGHVTGDSPDSPYFSEYSNSDKLRLDVYDPAQIRLHEFGKLANLELTRKASGEIELNKVLMRPGQARHYLMATVGLSKGAAEKMVAGPKHIVRFIVQPPGKKFASLADIKKLGYYQPSMEFPATQDSTTSESGQYSIESPEQLSSQAEQEPTRQAIEPWEDPSGQGTGSPTIDPQSQQTMTKDPSDTMQDMVGLISILRNTRIDSTIKSTTKALLSAIDRLGRQIITFHAHPEEFEELYGDGDVDDLESALVSTFEQAGDLFITLTRRASSTNPELDIAYLA